jgi:hypothetical protein
MIFVSVTRLRVRHWLYLPGFAWFTLRSVRQVKRAEGLLHQAVARDQEGAFWTLTTWQSEAAMRGFRNTGAHRKVMPLLAEWCDEATYAHWVQNENTSPSWAEAGRRLIAEGTVSRVLHPSPRHLTRAFPPPGMK